VGAVGVGVAPIRTARAAAETAVAAVMVCAASFSTCACIFCVLLLLRLRLPPPRLFWRCGGKPAGRQAETERQCSKSLVREAHCVPHCKHCKSCSFLRFVFIAAPCVRDGVSVPSISYRCPCRADWSSAQCSERVCQLHQRRGSNKDLHTSMCLRHKERAVCRDSAMNILTQFVSQYVVIAATTA